METLRFSDEKYKNEALNIKKSDNDVINPEDAFFLLINADGNLSKADLDNLCIEIEKKGYNYQLTQKLDLDSNIKKQIMESAYTCIYNGLPLGNRKTPDGRFNTSNWISHCMYSGIVCANLASAMGLDPERAKTLGLLHDFGRKFDHTFNHTIKGFEKLLDLGLRDEAVAALTHSFVNGGRCANNEPALDGFHIDENGNPTGIINDDIGLFLANYQYNLLFVMKKANWTNNQLKYIKLTKKTNDDGRYMFMVEQKEIEAYFNLVAICFYDEYKYFLSQQTLKRHK